MNKKTSIRIFLSFFAVTIMVFLILYTYLKSEIRIDEANSRIRNEQVMKLPRCTTLRSGNVKVEIEYPAEMYQRLSSNYIEIRRFNTDIKNEDGESEIVLTVYAKHYENLEDIIGASLVEPGPDYIKKDFNGYESAYFNIEDELGKFSHYHIPFGNKVIDLYYNYTNLSPDEKIMAEKMLRNMRFSEVERDIGELARVTNCQEQSYQKGS